MTVVDLKFDSKYQRWILSGDKIATIRLGPKGITGDTFLVRGRECEIISVCRMPFKCALDLYRWEGYKTRAGLFGAITSLYGSVDMDTIVYVHFFHLKEASD